VDLAIRPWTSTGRSAATTPTSPRRIRTRGSPRRETLELLGEIPRRRRITLGADKAYDVAGFVDELRQHEVHRGLPRVGWNFTFALAVYNLVRIRNLTMAPRM